MSVPPARSFVDKFGVLFEDTQGPAVHHEHGTYELSAEGKLDRGTVKHMRLRTWWTRTYERVQV